MIYGLFIGSMDHYAVDEFVLASDQFDKIHDFVCKNFNVESVNLGDVYTLKSNSDIFFDRGIPNQVYHVYCGGLYDIRIVEVRLL